MELSKNSTIKELIESKHSLKKLRTVLNVRDTTIKQVFNHANYFYDSKVKSWINDASHELDNTPFDDVLAQIKGKGHSTNEAKVNKQLIETNTIQNTNSITNSSANTELIETNSLELLNTIGLTQTEFSVLKSMIAERLEQHHDDVVDREGIYNQVAALKTRKRKNQTFYISEDLSKDVLTLAEDLGVKKSQLVEVALLKFMKQFSSIQ